jgi:hypothetical protein
VALRADGTILTWPDPNTSVPLGPFGFIDLACPEDFLSDAVLGLEHYGAIVESGATVPANAEGIAGIAAGSANSLAFVGGGPPVFPGLQANRTVCRGSTAYFRALAVGALPLSYQWNCNGTNIPGATDSVLVLANVQPQQAGSLYSLTASNAFGVATCGAMTLSEEPLEVTVQPQSLTEVPGATAAFNASTVGQGPFSCQWQFNGANLDGATNLSLSLTNLQMDRTGAYAVVVTNPYGTVTNSSASLNVVPVLISTQPSGATVLPGTNVNFNVAASGQSPLSYQWLWNGAVLPNATNASLTLSDVQPGQAGNYSVAISTPDGTLTSSDAPLNVVPVLITSPPFIPVALAGTTVSVSVTAAGESPFSYQWLFNGSAITEATNASLTLTNVQSSQVGSYSVVISNIYGAVVSYNAQLIVVPFFIASQPVSQTVPIGTNVTFTVSASGQSPLSYQWLWNGSALPYATNASLTLTNIQFDQAGTYSAVVGSAYGSNDSIEAGLNVVPLWLAAITPSQAAVAGTNLTLSASAGGQPPLSYQWVCDGTNVDGATNASLVLNDLQMNQSGAYSVEISNSYGTIITSGPELSVVPAVVTTQPKSATVLAGQIASFNVSFTSQAPCRFQWLFNGAILSGQTAQNLALLNVQVNQAGYYSLLISNVYGSVTSSVAALTVTPFSISYEPQGATVLAGQNATFTISARGQGPFSYQWQFNGISLAGATNSTLVLTNVQMNQAGAYSVIMSDPFASLASSPAQLIVVPISITAPPQDQVVFRGAAATLNVTAVSTQPINYQWQFNGTNLSVATNSSLILTNLQFNQAGLYSVVMSNALGNTNCAASLAVTPVAAWGDNAYGQTSVPATLTNIVALAAGCYHNLALQTDGTLVAWGDGDYGQTSVPQGLSNAVAVAAGCNHSLALLAGGAVVAWGDNTYGQTTIPSGLNDVVALAAGIYHNLALQADGTVVAWGDNTYGQTNVPPGLSNVVALAAGRGQSLALQDNGTVVVWGDNTYGQTNIPPGLTGIAAIAGGYYHSLVLLTNGAVVAWGDNTYGQTNVPSGLSNVVAVACGSYHSMALLADGGMVAWGFNADGETNTPSGLTNIVRLSGGANHSLALIGNQPPSAQTLKVSPAVFANGFNVSVATQSGKVYVLEYKNSLADSQWTALPLAAGNGGTVTLTDSGTPTPQRFYRVRQW